MTAGIVVFWIGVFLLLLMGSSMKHLFGKKYVVYDFETGMLFKNGKFIKILSSGMHRIFLDSYEVIKVDTRPAQISFQLSSITENKKILDHNTIVYFKISKPEIFIKESSVPAANIVLDKARLSIRDIFSQHSFDSICSKQNQIENELMEDANKEIAARGIEITKIDLIILSLSS